MKFQVIESTWQVYYIRWQFFGKEQAARLG